jgi:FkbM family methyltransferase
MSFLHTARRAARKLGVEVHRYNLAQSQEARLFGMLAHHAVDAVVDVGANDGGYALSLRHGGYRGPIISFEPLSAAHAAATQRAASDANWTLAPRCALGASAGMAEINIAGNSKSSSLLPMLQSHVDAAPTSVVISTESVPVSRLDDIELPELTAARRMFLKIDTQGYELPVLEGATRTLKRCVGVQAEMSLLPLYEGQVLFREIIGWLEQREFELWSLLPGFSDPATGRLLQVDGVFFRPEAESPGDR